MKKCNYCKHKMVKVLYFFFPMYFCEVCNNIYGFWSFLPIYLSKIESDTFFFYKYKGSYLDGILDFIINTFDKNKY